MTKNGNKFLIGTSGWIYPHWKGTFYPQELAQRKWFEYYAKKFNTVEINATFYRAFGKETYEKWRGNAPKAFEYVIKMHRIITHRRYLKNVKNEIQRAEQSAELLEDKLGVMLLQLPPQMPYEPERLRKALLGFKEPEKVVVEFRDKKWLTKETFGVLKELKVAFCSSDAPGIELIDWLTSKIGYIRLHGRDLSYSGCYSKPELKKIAKLAEKMVKMGAKKVYIFFNNDAEGYAPKNALELAEMLQ
jgi:uncharacterized protein YecE (DUF72 family)